MIQICRKKQNTLKAAAVFLSLLLILCTAMPLYVLAGPAQDILFDEASSTPLVLNWGGLRARAVETLTEAAAADTAAVYSVMRALAIEDMKAGVTAVYYPEGPGAPDVRPEVVDDVAVNVDASFSMDPALVPSSFTVTYTARHTASGFEKTGNSRAVTVENVTPPAAPSTGPTPPGPASAPPAAEPEIVFEGIGQVLKLDWTLLYEEAATTSGFDPDEDGEAFFQAMEDLARGKMLKDVTALYYPQGQANAATDPAVKLDVTLNAGEFSLHPVSGKAEYNISYTAKSDDGATERTEGRTVQVTGNPAQLLPAPNPATDATPYLLYCTLSKGHSSDHPEYMGEYETLQQAVNAAAADCARRGIGSGEEMPLVSEYEIVVTADDSDVTRVAGQSPSNNTNIPIRIAAPTGKHLPIRLVSGEKVETEPPHRYTTVVEPRTLTHVNPLVAGQAPAACFELSGRVSLALNGIVITKSEGSVGNGISAGMAANQNSDEIAASVIMFRGSEIKNIPYGTGVALRGVYASLTMWPGAAIRNCHNRTESGDVPALGGGVYLCDTNGKGVGLEGLVDHNIGSGLSMVNAGGPVYVGAHGPVIEGNSAFTPGDGTGGGGGGAYLDGVHLTMQSGASISRNTTNGSGAGVMQLGDLPNNNDFDMSEGACIEENEIKGDGAGSTSSGSGGGVYCVGVQFNMHGGSICNNTAGHSGGGVYLQGRVEDGKPVKATPFRMFSGTISGNKARLGGGVAVGLYATLKMMEDWTLAKPAPAVITGNTAYGKGGGVYLAKAPAGYEDSTKFPTSFIMEFGSVEKNKALTTTNSTVPIQGDGGGIYVELTHAQPEGEVGVYPAQPDPATFHANLSITGLGEKTFVEENTASRGPYDPPANHAKFNTREKNLFPGELLNNSNINYVPLKSITYYANNGDAGGPQEHVQWGTKPVGVEEDFTILGNDATKFVAPFGKEFSHWTFTQSGKGQLDVPIMPGDPIYNEVGSHKLYAQWKDASILVSIICNVRADMQPADPTKRVTYTLSMWDEKGRSLEGMEFTFNLGVGTDQTGATPTPAPPSPGININGDPGRVGIGLTPDSEQYTGTFKLDNESKVTFTMGDQHHISLRIPITVHLKVEQSKLDGYPVDYQWAVRGTHIDWPENTTDPFKGSDEGGRVYGEYVLDIPSVRDVCDEWKEKDGLVTSMGITFTNWKKITPPTGVAGGDVNAAVGLGAAGLLPALGAAALGAAALGAARRKKQRGRRNTT